MDWKGSVTAQVAAKTFGERSYPHWVGEWCIYLSPTATDDGSQVMALHAERLGDGVRLSHSKPKGGCDLHSAQVLTPCEFDLGLEIHEYGGKPFWIFDETVYFIHRGDRALYRFSLTVNDESLTASVPSMVSSNCSGDEYWCLAQINRVSDSWLIAIGELHSPDVNEPKAALISLCLTDDNCTPIVIHKGADFYSDLQFDPVHGHIAWIEWMHPFMPWQANRVSRASLVIEEGGLKVASVEAFPAINGASFAQLCFSSTGTLFGIADFAASEDEAANFWNVYQFDWLNKELLAVTNDKVEYAYPHWQFGNNRLLSAGSLLVGISSSPTSDALWCFDLATQTSVKMEQGATIEQLSLTSDGVGFVARPMNSLPELRHFSFELSRDISVLASNDELLKRYPPDDDLPIEEQSLSEAQHFTYPTRDGHQAHAFYYPPKNQQYTALGLPPVVVMVHGGPTARAYGHFDVQKQFWTSHGFAVLDINHRGSTGYGRYYRDMLEGRWGDIDCSDIVDAIDFASSVDWIDASAVCIRGKSAGGYAVLRALTEHPDRFVAGASYYGIGDLTTLAQITHKFEKHYTDSLVGEVYSPENSCQSSSRYYTRSPLNYIERLSAPMIVFQGAKDKIVPPSLAHEIITALNDNSIENQYVEYPNEAHGFRDTKTKQHSLEQELAFFRRSIEMR